ncbi:MAG: sugar phosphate isomerase/epimerase family protein [Woeseia sp.]
MHGTNSELTRRNFVLGAIGVTAAAVSPGSADGARSTEDDRSTNLSISLAQWSLHRAFQGGQRDPREFAQIARREFGIGGIEYVNQFYFETLNDKLVADLRTRAEGEDVQSLLIMCDREGDLGDPDSKSRSRTVANHHRWADAARALGCHSIRVNASSAGSAEEQARLVADGLNQLAEYCSTLDLNVLVENHGGLSSNGRWLADVMRMTSHPRVGTLPDFGNFVIDAETGERYDNYLGVEELMPFAHAVSAKSYDFNLQGNETCIDYFRMLRIVADAKYTGWVGIEWEGSRIDEDEGIRRTQALLQRAIAALDDVA